MSTSEFLYISGVLLLSCAGAAYARDPQRNNSKECSSEIVNGNCIVTIHRDNPVSPPTIQVARGKTVRIVVDRALPLEEISIDRQPVTLVRQPDAFQSVFQAMSSSFKSLAIVTTVGFDSGCTPPPELEAIGKRQIAIAKDATGDPASIGPDAIAKFNDGAKVINDELQEILKPPSANERRRLTNPNPRSDFSGWKRDIVQKLMQIAATPAIDTTKLKAHENDLRQLQIAIMQAQAKEPPSGDPNHSCYEAALRVLQDDQTTLALGLKQISDMQASFLQYAQTIQAATDPKPPDPVNVQDPAVDPEHPQQISFKGFYRKVPLAIAATNKLSKTPQKQTIANVTIVYGSTRVEVFSGAIFSAFPSRSFQASPVIVNGVKTNTEITQSITRPTVVPFASGNYLFKEWDTDGRGKRWGLYGTGGIGVNPYSTSADFMAGLSISYRSVVLSPLCHFSRDLRLTQGLYVDELLGNSNAPTPTTERYWRPAFAVGISVRLSNLLGGGGSGSSSSGGS